MATSFTTNPFLTKEVIMNLDPKKTIAKYAQNTMLEGQLRKEGDTVRVQNLPDVEWNKGGTAGADITASSFAITQESLTISDTFQINEEITDLQEVQYNRILMSDITSRIAEGQARVQDKYVAAMVRDANASNQFNEATPLAVTVANSLTTVEQLRVALEDQNVDVGAGDVGLFISPNFASLLRQGNWLTNTEAGVDVNIKGYLGRCSGMNIYQSNLLPSVVNLTMDTQPTANDTLTINGITWTYVAAGTAAAAGEIALTGSLAGDQANLINAIMGTGTAGAATYVDVSAANRTALENLDIYVGTFASNVAKITASSTLTVSETFTAVTNIFGTVGKLAFAIKKGAINIAYQLNKMKVTEATQGFRSNILGEMVAGRKVFATDAKKIATTRIVS